MANEDKSWKNRESREEKQQKRMERKLELAQRQDMEVISRRAVDTSDFIRLIGTTDFLMSLVRSNMGRRGRIDGVKGVEFITRVGRIKEEINLLNAEMCRELGKDYKPPYGFENPLKEEREVAER
jgi:hypothetical protein